MRFFLGGKVTPGRRAMANTIENDARRERGPAGHRRFPILSFPDAGRPGYIRLCTLIPKVTAPISLPSAGSKIGSDAWLW